MVEIDDRIRRDTLEIVELRQEADRLEARAARLRRNADEVQRRLDNAITANMLGR